MSITDPTDGEQLQRPSIAEVAEHGVTPAMPSVLDHLRNSATRARAIVTKDIPIPDYDGLYVTFKLLKNYEETREKLLATLKRRGLSAGKREVAIAVAMLLASSVDSFAVIGGEKINSQGQPGTFGVPIGVDLYDLIWPAQSDTEPRPQTDAEAVHMLFDSNTVRITTIAAELDQWFKSGEQEAADDVVGES